MLEEKNRNILVKGDSIRVLIIDDDEDYQALCARYLSQDSKYNYSLECVATAAQALEVCRSQEFDCIIVDYKLPDSVGTDVIFDLHCTLGQWMPPAVIVTAGGGEEAATQAVRVNAADFLSKRDVTASALIQSIEKIVKQARLKAAAQVKNEELNEAYEKLQHETKEIKSFYHTVAHEVNTPLAAIKEFLSLIEDETVGPINKDQRELIKYSLESCDQIGNHFTDLLDLIRLETGKLQLNRQFESPSRLIDRCTKAVAGIAQSKGVELVDKSSCSLPEISIDSDRISQVISNLLDNALKHTDSGGYIHIDSSYEESENIVKIHVKDSGCGIDSDQIDKIYDRLYQVSDSKKSSPSVGLGIGLSISNELIKLHGGQLDVDSQLGVGSVFTMKLQAQTHA